MEVEKKMINRGNQTIDNKARDKNQETYATPLTTEINTQTNNPVSVIETQTNNPISSIETQTTPQGIKRSSDYTVNEPQDNDGASTSSTPLLGPSTPQSLSTMNSLNNERPTYTLNILNALYNDEINRQPPQFFGGFASEGNPQLTSSDPTLYDDEINRQPPQFFGGFASEGNPQLTSSDPMNMLVVRPRARVRFRARQATQDASQSSQAIPLYSNSQEGLNAREMRLVTTNGPSVALEASQSRMITTGHPRAHIIGGHPRLRSNNAIQRVQGNPNDLYKKQRVDDS
jgi:hypothetical protein